MSCTKDIIKDGYIISQGTIFEVEVSKSLDSKGNLTDRSVSSVDIRLDVSSGCSLFDVAADSDYSYNEAGRIITLNNISSKKTTKVTFLIRVDDISLLPSGGNILVTPVDVTPDTTQKLKLKTLFFGGLTLQDITDLIDDYLASDPALVGPAGPTTVLNIGAVTSGVNASASITGTPPNLTLNLTLPKGDTGDTPTPIWSGTSLAFDTTGDGSANTVAVDLQGPSGSEFWADIVDKPTISVSSTSDVVGSLNLATGILTINIPSIPENTSDLVNDSGFITGVAWGAITSRPTIAVISSSGVSGSLNLNTGSLTLNIPSIPANTSDLTNDSGFITSQKSDASINNLIEAALVHANHTGVSVTRVGDEERIEVTKTYDADNSLTLVGKLSPNLDGTAQPQYTTRYYFPKPTNMSGFELKEVAIFTTAQVGLTLSSIDDDATVVNVSPTAAGSVIRTTSIATGEEDTTNGYYVDIADRGDNPGRVDATITLFFEKTTTLS